ncbi:PREDICTED: protein PHYLLO, chloroplastic isoform X3 [Populus euphratica]|uniref:Protein PHYLLO, chloroplastic isoform X3 n=1 Tax=Populus euphratica TaxID=75702 RepID=A0AAJ6TER6_POPEU|nr:PREDICTED: protein PHYLLO, chloroplastic isoform X3 [Populus euphratica]
MKPHILLLTNNLPLPSPNIPFGTRKSLPLAFLSRNTSIHFPRFQNPKFKVVEAVRYDCPVTDVTELEGEDCELVLETCITRTLPPALTLERGIESIKAAVDDLKSNPPCSLHGVFRFQVAVPPSPKALNWFCSLPESDGVFPRFFQSKETEDASCKKLYLRRTRGVFGLGSAICFEASSYCAPEKLKRIRRYLSSDSTHIMTYGFMDINFNKESSSIKHEAGSFYFLIPEVELDEQEEASILVITLAWDENSCWTFEQAIQSFESSIYQASFCFWPDTERCYSKCIKSTFRNFNLMEAKTFQMACTDALFLDRRDYQADTAELVFPFSWTKFSSQFCFRLSPVVGVSSNMLDDAGETSYSLQDQSNINAVWASLIVEECSRLGIMYFCVAPGSRSSPLAIAASTHPLTTCISCFDERSLAFHAVGYSKGSHKPAVIITSSGTAVSNLLPAVVEASQDFVPLLLLTADRPPELLDAGANQAINQVNHFGSFVRFTFSLPAPTDNIPARMVLTTIDSAVHWATSLPYGPVHINCPFREPLDDSSDNWMLNCLKGLDIWMSGAEPFTKYIQLQNSLACKDGARAPMAEVLEIIKGTDRGLLLVGAIHTEDEIWAALLLAKHLNWPVAADILSGLRLRKLLPSLPEIEENVLFVDHLDHALLSEWVRGWIHFDVIVQIGSRITSKRVSQMVEECFPCTYILVDNHPCRHDPSHFVTHRVQCSIHQFADSLMKAQFPHRNSKWCCFLRVLNTMVAWDISFQINAENSLTEPYVAHVITEALSAESALFVGNSMVIRDADMYGHNCKTHAHSIAHMMLDTELPYLGIRVVGNRGASGIDGLLSTAIGFAVGCNKQVLCLVGDVSMLHDTNGLAILTQRVSTKPMRILVINNHGGAIFSLLPIADKTDPRILDQYFYTSHRISIHKLCAAHSVRHLQVKTKVELQEALLKFEHEKTDCVIEVESSIGANSTFHSTLRKSAQQAADHALSILSRLSVRVSISDGLFLCKIHKMDFSLYRIQLCAPPTSSSVDHHQNEFHREGYILSVSLEDGSVGYGEVAPLEIHKENLSDVEEQLLFLLHVIKGIKINVSLAILKGSFTSWIWSNLGIMECSIFPSVRCGLEMAILNAIAVSQGSSFISMLQPWKINEEIYEKSSVKICALIDSNGTPTEVAYIASSLVEEGFTAIKLKVARRADPIQDATVICKVRKEVGPCIEIRADANRKWTYEEAIQFGFLVKDCDLQYIEEPVENVDDIVKFCEETGLPAALDETINNFQESHLKMLAKYTHPGIVAVDNVVIFLHGFLGTGEDWVPIMKAISRSAKCISVDLPGHGGSKIQNHVSKGAQEEATLSIEIVADVLYKLIQGITPSKVTLVGYSMGARIALHMALRLSHKIDGAVIISGSPGLKDTTARKIRQAKDDSRADFLVAYGLELFLDSWYAGEFWKSLRSHPHFKEIVAGRLVHEDVQSLAKALSGLSTGSQLPLWEDLKRCNLPLLLIVGEKDAKFKSIAQKMLHEVVQERKGEDCRGDNVCEILEVPNCGHAVHLENPLPVISAMRKFLTRGRSSSRAQH